MPVELREETFYTAQETANLLGVHLRTVRRMLKSGELIGSRLGNRVFIADKILQELLSAPAANKKYRLAPETREKMREIMANARAVLYAKREAQAKQAQGNEYRYRIVYGEAGNEVGYIEDLPGVSTDSGARAALTRRMKKYGKPGEAWGRVQYRCVDDAPDAWRPLEG